MEPPPPSSSDRTKQIETSLIMSGLTRQNSRDLVQSGEISSSGIKVSEPSTEWTDEKHRLYLSSMEAAFVRQLYNLEYPSKDALDYSSRGRNKVDLNSSRQLNANNQTSSPQFKVLRGGCWKKLNFERPRPQLDSTDETRAPGNPWIQHFKSGGKHREVTSPSLQEHSAPFNQAVHMRGQNMAASSKHFSACYSCLCCQDSVGSITDDSEVSDQNFDNEDYEWERISRVCKSKRMKTEAAEESTKDQVVPIGKSPITADPNEKCASPQTEAEFVSDGQSQ